QSLCLSANTHVLLYDVVVGCHILVADRPILPITVIGGGLKVQIAQAQADSPPDVCAPSRHSQASLPTERLALEGRIRFVKIVAEPFVVVFHAGIAVLLHRTRLANQSGGSITVFQIESWHVLGEIFVRLGAATVYQGHFEPCLRQPLARPSS